MRTSQQFSVLLNINTKITTRVFMNLLHKLLTIFLFIQSSRSNVTSIQHTPKSILNTWFSVTVHEMLA